MSLFRSSSLFAAVSSTCCLLFLPLSPAAVKGASYPPAWGPPYGSPDAADGRGAPTITEQETVGAPTTWTAGSFAEAPLVYTQADDWIGLNQEADLTEAPMWIDPQSLAQQQQQQLLEQVQQQQEQMQRAQQQLLQQVQQQQEQLQQEASVTPSMQIGSGLMRFVTLLERSDLQTRAALLRFFCVAVARLKYPYLGIPPETEAERRERRKRQAQETREEGAVEVSKLVARLHGLLSAASSSVMTETAMASSLLLPFTRLVREAENRLYTNARQGDIVAFVAATKALGPRLKAGLSHLAGPLAAAGASGVADPVRQSLLLRLKQLDMGLDGAASNLETIRRVYAEELSDDLLERERQKAELEGRHHVLSPPAVVGASNNAEVKRKGSIARWLSFFFFMLFAFVFISFMMYSVHQVDMSIRERAEETRRRMETPPTHHYPGYMGGGPSYDPSGFQGYPGGPYGGPPHGVEPTAPPFDPSWGGDYMGGPEPSDPPPSYESLFH
ncbi:hypothetical protein Emed_007015 [Eimeria media]